jgi:hypothetical protein
MSNTADRTFWNPWSGSSQGSENNAEIAFEFAPSEAMESVFEDSASRPAPSVIIPFMDSANKSPSISFAFGAEDDNLDQASPSTLTGWVNQQSDLNALKSFEDLDPEIEEFEDSFDSNSVSFFQGFRAAVPPPMKVRAEKASLKFKKIVAPMIRKLSTTSAGTAASTGSRFSRLPSEARQQVTAINSISKIFNELLSERDALLGEATKLENDLVIDYLRS